MSDAECPPTAPSDGTQRAAREWLARTDSDLARITEDLIDILIARGVIQLTDFPPEAQAKLLQRRQTRVILSQRLQLLDEGGDELIQN